MKLLHEFTREMLPIITSKAFVRVYNGLALLHWLKRSVDRSTDLAKEKKGQHIKTMHIVLSKTMPID